MEINKFLDDAPMFIAVYETLGKYLRLGMEVKFSYCNFVNYNAGEFVAKDKGLGIC